jgi:hypothetical protein
VAASLGSIHLRAIRQIPTRPVDGNGDLMLIGYARVSTAGQNSDLQRDAITRAGCERVFTDQASGARRDGARFNAGTHARRLGGSKGPRPQRRPPAEADIATDRNGEAVVTRSVGLFRATLIYGDGAITPSISVLSALESFNMATPAFEPPFCLAQAASLVRKRLSFTVPIRRMVVMTQIASSGKSARREAGAEYSTTRGESADDRSVLQ